MLSIHIQILTLILGQDSGPFPSSPAPSDSPSHSVTHLPPYSLFWRVFYIVILEFQYFRKSSRLKWDARMWIGLILLRIESSDALLSMAVTLKVP
jgi:hypothetical protein